MHVTVRRRTPPLEPLTVDELRDFIASHRWRFARTMPMNPHDYLLRERCRDQHEFERVIHTINVWGFKEHYGSRDYPVIDVDMGGGLIFKLWHMDQLPISETKLINRALRSYEVPPDILRMVDMQSRITASLQRVLSEPSDDRPRLPDPEWSGWETDRSPDF
jgi:hypothetical protein